VPYIIHRTGKFVGG